MLPSKRRILQNVHTDTENPCKSVGRQIQIRTASISEQQRTEWNRNKGTLFVKLLPRHVARGAESLAFFAFEGHIYPARNWAFCPGGASGFRVSVDRGNLSPLLNAAWSGDKCMVRCLMPRGACR
jgi:hypothetical protein